VARELWCIGKFPGFIKERPGVPSFLMPALTATPAQRADLRAQAHALHPVVIIGGDGLTDAVLAEIERSLAAHQLIKIRVFGDERDARLAIYEQICDRLNAAPVQHIGKLLVIWRPAPPAPAARKRSGLPSAAEASAGRSSRGNGPRQPAHGPARAQPARALRPAADAQPEERAPRPVPRAGAKGGAPRIVTVVKPNPNSMRRSKPQKVLVRGNERVTAGGEVKRTKKRQTSVKRQHQSSK
jgi:putative YhbY family RNA-binding protein